MNASAAGNYQDSKITDLKVTSSQKYIDGRPKLDATSATIKLSKAKTPVVVRVYGMKSAKGIKKDFTAGTPKVVKVSKKYTYLPNYVKENGRGWACLGFVRAGDKNVTITGVWSPDSI